ERERVVDLHVGTAVRRLRDVLCHRVGRQQLRAEQGLRERLRICLVDLAEAAGGAGGLRLAGAAGARRREHQRRAEYERQHHQGRSPSAYVHRSSFSVPQPVLTPTARWALPPVSVGRRTRPRIAATRSPETSIPTRIAAPKTMYCIAVESPRISSICV